MADVHRATDTLLEREVAVKLLREQDSSPADRDRFAAEARTVGRLNHPGIVPLLDAGLDPALDRPFLVLELVAGPSLASRIADGPLPSEEVARMAAELGAALAYAHGQGVVHRDVKPGNVLIDAHGHARLTDFGIARRVGARRETGTDLVVGSPAYVAPEQVAGEPVGPPADVYALGLVLLEALTGRRAFHGTGVEVAYARVHAAPEMPVSLGPTWIGVLSAMTARDPADRPDAGRIAAMLAHPPTYDPAETTAIQAAPLVAATPWRPRPKVVAAVGVVAASVLLGLLSLGTPKARPADTDPQAVAPVTQAPTTREGSATRARPSAPPQPVLATRARPVAHHIARPRAHHVQTKPKAGPRPGPKPGPEPGPKPGPAGAPGHGHAKAKGHHKH